MVNVHQILVRAKELYSSNDDYYGMCAAFEDAFEELNPEKIRSVSYAYIRDYIPEFNPYFLEAPFDSGFWWSPSDHYSRLEAFNKLIALYE